MFEDALLDSLFAASYLALVQFLLVLWLELLKYSVWVGIGVSRHTSAMAFRAGSALWARVEPSGLSILVVRLS